MNMTGPPTSGALACEAGSAAAFEVLPHTADLRVAMRATSLEALYAAAGETVRRLLVGDSPVVESEEREVVLANDEPGERFFRFVRELLFLYDSEGFLPARIVPGAPVRVLGERFDPLRHTAERQLKAVTRHGFELRREAGGYRAELLFDV
jgi:SHS2 domain-containing protein